MLLISYSSQPPVTHTLSTGFRVERATRRGALAEAVSSDCMAYRWLLGFWGSSKGRMAEHHRNQPLCSLLDSDGNAETSVDTGAETETAAYAGGRGGNHGRCLKRTILLVACMAVAWWQTHL